MGKYILKRILVAIPVFFGITLLVYVLSNMAPGSPVSLLAAATDMTQEQLEAYKVYLGLDKPVIVRYGIWVWNFVHGDLGLSSATNQPVFEMIAERAGATLVLTLSALCLSLIVGVPLGILAAKKPNSGWDTLSNGVAFLGSSIPNFFIALICICVFAVQLKLLPASGMYTSTTETSVGDLLRHLVMPASLIALSIVGNFIKQTKGAVLEVLGEDYVRTARAKGIGSRKVTWRHILRNSLTPVVTEISTGIPFLVAGSVTIERIFSWPGIGSLMLNAISGRDYNVITGITAVVAVIVLVANLLLDIVYSWLDPRVDFKAMKN